MRHLAGLLGHAWEDLTASQWCLNLHSCKTNLGSLKNLSVGWSFVWGLCGMLED